MPQTDAPPRTAARPRWSLSAGALAAGILLAPVALVSAAGPAAAAPVAPSGPQQPGPSQQDRALRYFDMTYQDAMYTALVEGDFEFAIATLGGMANATNTRELLDFVTGVQALKRGDSVAAERAFAGSPGSDFATGAMLMVIRVQLGRTEAAAQGWQEIGEQLGGQPFHTPWRGWLAEQAGNRAGALAAWREADRDGELLFNPAIAKRYFVLLAEADGARAAVARMDDIFGPVDTMSVEMRQLRTDIQRGRARLPALSPAQAGAQFLGDYVNLMRLARMSPAARGQRNRPADPDGEFISDALYLRTALVLEPGSARLRSQLADLLSDYGEPGAARAVLEAPGGPPPTADTLMELADYAADQHRTRDAIRFLEQVAVPDRSSSWHIDRAEGALALGESREAVRLAREAVRISERSGDDRLAAIGNWRLASILFRTGDRAGGIASLQSAIDALRGDDVLRPYLGLMLATFVPERRDEGIGMARAGQGRFGDTPHFRAGLGALLSEQEATLEEGVELLRAALGARPRSADMLNALGYTLVDREVDLQEGFLLLQRAHERLPDNAAIVDSLGWAHYRLGHLDEARVLVERSAELFAEDPNAEVFDHLGDIYWHLGRQDDARAQWRRALPIAAGYRGAAAIPGKIERGLDTPPPPRQRLPVAADPDSI